MGKMAIFISADVIARQWEKKYQFFSEIKMKAQSLADAPDKL
jgi:hypothetical protein